MTKLNVAGFQSELQTLLNELAAKHGLVAPQVDVRRFRNDIGVRIMKTDVMIASVANTAPVEIGEVPFTLENAMKAHGLTKKFGRKGEELTGFKSSSPKYPFTMTGAKGGRWKITVEQAKSIFSKTAENTRTNRIRRPILGHRRNVVRVSRRVESRRYRLCDASRGRPSPRFSI